MIWLMPPFRVETNNRGSSVFRHREDVSIWILEPRDLTGGTFPDAEFVLVHEFIPFKDDAGIPQIRNDRFDIFDFPAEDSRGYRFELLHFLRDDLDVSAAEDRDVRVLILESKPESLFVEKPRALRVRDPNESVYWKSV
jgi:hypothetical protein